MKKFLNFNDKAILLNVDKENNKASQHPNSLKSDSESKLHSKICIDPAIQQIKALMASISNVKIAHENLIYEEF